MTTLAHLGPDVIGSGALPVAMAVAATAADGGITICGAEAVEKSAPAFWSEFASLGGSAQ